MFPPEIILDTIFARAAWELLITKATPARPTKAGKVSSGLGTRGYGGALHAADQDAAGTAPEKSLNDAWKKFGQNLAEGLAKPMGEMLKGVVQSNPGFVEQIYKGRHMTPLHLAAWDNKTEEAKQLLAAGVDVDARDVNGSTPLHYAAYAFGGDIIPVLLAAGADVNAKDNDGCTPFHVAMVVGGHGGEKAIPYLLQGKANVNAGWTMEAARRSCGAALAVPIWTRSRPCSPPAPT